MISKALTDEENRQEAIKFTLEVLKAQPTLLPHTNGGTTARIVIDMADSFITYITGKAPGSTT